MNARLSSRMKIALGLFLVGWLLLLTGLAYDLMFAAPPDPEPNPRREAAERLELIGLIVAGVGTVVICLVLGVTALRRRAGSTTGV